MHLTRVLSLQVLCPCAKRRERRAGAEALDDILEDSDTNTLGLSAQDLRDPAAIVSSPNTTLCVCYRSEMLEYCLFTCA